MSDVITPDPLRKFKYDEPPHYSVRQMFIDYSRERLIAKGKEVMRAWIGFNHFMDVVPPQQEVTKITLEQVERYVDESNGRGRSPLTARRELALIKAAIHNAHKHHRIKEVPYIELPDGENKFRRPLTEDEFQVVIAQNMTERLRRFYWVAYFTGHRSQAIEQLTWDRVHLVQPAVAGEPWGWIDFNVPGRRTPNKKRASDFPIDDRFAALLSQWERKDKYVIGAGGSTYRPAHHLVRVVCGLIDPTLVPRHCMRKKFATHLFELGMDPEVVGHLMADDPKTLREHYVKFNPKTLHRVASKIGR